MSELVQLRQEARYWRERARRRYREQRERKLQAEAR